MKQFISKIKLTAGLLIWDLIMSSILLFLLILSLDRIEDSTPKVIVLIAVCCFILVMMIVKYKELYRQNGKDSITGGNNKREFERIVRKMLNRDGRYVLVYANIDRFKLINEAYGDAEGDAILRKIQKIIDDEIRFDGVSGRIMADNFGILLRYHSMPKLEERLQRISSQLAKLHDADGNSYGITLYFGVYVVPENDGQDISTMLEHANMARKKISPSHLVPMGIYDEKDRERLGREKRLEMKMHRALEQGHFIPFLQPKYELEGEKIAGAEALVRWIDPEEGMIYPNEFIPLFENNGFVVKVDLYMFEQVCRIVDRWRKEGKKIIPISVNLSRSHFQIPNFFMYYRKILEKYDIPPKAIEIELTESMFYNDTASLNNLVTQIHESGLSCSIDDFGSGYSSLNMLKEVQVDALKLDRVFFDHGVEDQRGRDIIQSVIRLAQALDLHTISEGVEERRQVEFLKSMQCDLIQGYVFAKPMPVPEFEKIAFEAE